MLNQKKTIEINSHEGEIGREQECSHNPSFTFQNLNSDEDVWYEVNIHIVQEKTSSLLNVKKEFYDEPNAIEFMKMFVKENPISEGIIIKKTSKEIMYYI